MAIRSVISRTSMLLNSNFTSLSCFSTGSGRILSEEERAAENVWAKKREKEIEEKRKLKIQKEEAEKAKADKKAGEDAAKKE